MNLSIIIPVFNEEKTILEILNRINVLKKICKIEVIVINDGSSDNSKNIIESNSQYYSKFIDLKITI